MNEFFGKGKKIKELCVICFSLHVDLILLDNFHMIFLRKNFTRSLLNRKIGKRSRNQDLAIINLFEKNNPKDGLDLGLPFAEKIWKRKFFVASQVFPGTKLTATDALLKYQASEWSDN